MRGLLVIDVQNVIVEFKDFQQELTNIEEIIHDFQDKEEPIIFIRNIDDNEESAFYKKSSSSELHDLLSKYADLVIEKKTPSAFFQTELQDKLIDLGVDHVTITGFNTEFCCQFTAIAAYDRGYRVTFVEDATGTVNDAETYEMKGLDIKEFVGKALHWSNVIEVIDIDEYGKKYKLSEAQTDCPITR